MNKKFLKLSALFFLSLFLCVFPAIAQSNKVYRGQIMEPIFTILNMKRGETYADGYVKFYNNLDTSIPIDLSISVSDFRVGDDGASKVELTDVPYQSSLAKWIKLSKTSITLKQNESIQIGFTITVPPYAEYGGKYASISFLQNNRVSNPNNQIPLVSRIQHTVLVNVDGNRKEQLQILSFTADKSLYEDTDVKFLTSIRNTGNVHLIPKGKILIDGGLFGGGTELEFNPAASQSLGYVLPDSNGSRTYENKWKDDGFKIGQYKATLTMQFGDNTVQSVTVSTTFWIFPWKTVLAALVILISLITIWTAWSKHKERKVLTRKVNKRKKIKINDDDN